MSAKKTSSEQEMNKGFVLTKIDTPEPTFENASPLKKAQVRTNQKIGKFLSFFKKSSDFQAIGHSVLDIVISGLIINTGMIVFGFPLQPSLILSFGCLYWFFFKKIYQYLIEIVKEFALSKHYK